MKDLREDAEFVQRRDAARARLDELAGAKGGDPADRRSWFELVYAEAGGDAAAVPWADLAPKPQLLDWLAAHPGQGRAAVDVACGLGDNAEAMAEAGWRVTAFDVAPSAIDWARRRHPESRVDYQAADLFALPAAWRGAFDLVHECYTLQALDGPLRSRAFAAIADLVAPGGTLLVITRTRAAGTAADGPPWPLTPDELDRFAELGLRLQDRHDYVLERPDGRRIPHARVEWRRL